MVDFRSHLVAESDRFVSLLDPLVRTDPDRAVPTCPDWSAADLLWHLGEVQHFWATIIVERLTSPDSYPQPARPDTPAELITFFGDANRMLVDALDATADDVSAWTWFAADQSVGFIRRRQAHEALIHRLDAEAVAGTPPGEVQVDPALAADGVLEAVGVMFGGAPDWGTVSNDGPTGLITATDTGHRWRIQVAHLAGTSPNTGTTYTAEPLLHLIATGERAVGPADFDLTATAADLDAWMWNRPTTAPVRVTGDADEFRAIIAEGLD